MLSVKEVRKNFGNLRALDGVTLTVESESITGLIGPNGSGKTTLFNVISGFYQKDGGEVIFKGRRIDGLPPDAIAKRGLCRTFQIAKAPEKLTVLENMLLAADGQRGENPIGALFNRRLVSKVEKANLNRAVDLLTILQLRGLSNEYAGNLSGGQKKLLSLGRMLMRNPDMILLDEPTAGVNPTLANDLLKTIKGLQDELKKAFLIVEHNMKVVANLCNKVFVLNFGKLLAEGTPEEIQQNDQVLKAYLGGA